MVGAWVGMGVGGHRLPQKEHETPSGGQSKLKWRKMVVVSNAAFFITIQIPRLRC